MVKLNGGKDKIANDPIKRGAKYITKKRLFKKYLIFY